MEETTYICERCGERVPADACTMVADTILCPDCVDMYTTVCDCCGERLFLSDDQGDENITLCERCYERHYMHCERCGRVISYSDAYYEDDEDDDEDEPLCYDCLQAHLQQATIHDYSYTPRLIFHGERSNERFFGVELEIDGNGKSRKNAGEILNVANEDAQNLYIKSDGSLDCGMELVTHPMTLQYHTEQMPWKNVLRKAVGLGYLSHRTTTADCMFTSPVLLSAKPSRSRNCRLRGCSTSSRNSGLSYCDFPDVPSGRLTAGQHDTA